MTSPTTFHTRFLTTLFAAFALLATPAFADPNGSAEVQEWSKWEMKANTARFTKSSSLNLKVVTVNKTEVVIDAEPGMDPAILKRFVQGNKVLFPIHPDNTSSEVPFQANERVAEWSVNPTASRSVVHFDPLFTIKLPTDRPHGSNGPAQPGKVKLYKSVLVSRDRSRHIQAVDAAIGMNDKLVVMRDILSIRDKKGGNGFIVRDLSAMKPGHHYLPAFSIPYVGKEIAKANGAEFREFWKQHDAIPYGRIKAQMLTRYGLWFETPNAQNRLIELDKNLKPTGRILLRDLSDSQFFKPVAEALGFNKEISAENRAETARSFDPNTINSYWQMSEGPISAQDIQAWETAHTESYRETLKSEFGVEVTDFSRVREGGLEFLTKRTKALRKKVASNSKKKGSTVLAKASKLKKGSGYRFKSAKSKPVMQRKHVQKPWTMKKKKVVRARVR